MSDGPRFLTPTHILDEVAAVEQILRDSRERLRAAQSALRSTREQLTVVRSLIDAGTARLTAREPQSVVVMHRDAQFRELLVRLLTREGYAATAYPHAVECARACRRDPPDLVVLDVDGTPGHTWYTARRLRADPQTRHIPVVVLTGEVDGIGPRPASLGTRCEVVTGPVDVPAFLETVRRLVRAPTTGRGETGDSQ